jgi:hypothetical protein
MAQVDLEYARAPDGTLRLTLGGDWRLGRGIPEPKGILGEIERSPVPPRVIFATGALTSWDSGLLTYLRASRSISTDCPTA